MLKWIILVSLCVEMSYGQRVQQEPQQDKVFFANSRMANDYFYSEAVYQSPAWIKNSNGKLPVSEKNFTPGNALERS